MPEAWQVIAARYGTLDTTLGEAYHRWPAYGEPDGPARLDYYFWVLRGEGETILVDTGFHPEAGRRRGRTVLIEPTAAMARLGVTADTVSRVLITHLHYDHTGNLAAFPDAELLVPAVELDFWLGPMGRRGQFAHHTEEADLDLLSTAVDQGRVRSLVGGEEIADGVGVIHLGGHSPGQMAVTTPAALLASDAVHFYDELERDRPFAVVADLAEMYEAYDTVREVAGGAAHIVPGHDPAVMDRYPRVEDFAVEIR
jgi:glyoxylase-like metal-dependent hydrolase (beta-lactamase superfamily II)